MDILLNQWYSPIVGLIGLIIGLISIPLSIFLYRRGQRLKKPCWSVTNTILIEGYSSSLEELGITYKNQKVENLSVGRIAFWNEGRETVDISDLTKTNPLRIQARNGINILDAKIVVQNNNSSAFSGIINEERTSAIIKFEYIDQNQGVVIQIVHTGVSSKAISIEGDIKGSTPLRRKKHSKVRFSPKLFRSKFFQSPKRRRWVVAIPLLFMSILTLVMAGFMFYYFVDPEGYLNVNEPNPFMNVIFGVFFILFGIYFFRRGFAYLRSSIPSGLELFEEDILPSEDN